MLQRLILLAIFHLISIHLLAGNDTQKPLVALYSVDPPRLNVAAPSPAGADIRPRPRQVWWKLAMARKLDLADTAIRYPRFIKFCVDVYNWGDRFFNSYNPEYVVGTGKRWKVRILEDNWSDAYDIVLPKDMNVKMLSKLYSNIGAYIQYMAVSVGTTYDISKFFSDEPVKHKKWEFGFNCALFNAELYYQENTGGNYLRKFGKFKDGKLIKEKFPGLELYNLGFEGYYFFNNKRYSHGAAYNFSKIQKKSQGSFLAGISFTNLKLSLDFRQLNPDLLPYLTIPADNYLFHYKSYCALFGYGYNWVIRPRLLFNITAMPSIGLSHCYEDSLEGERYMLAMNIAGRTSITYNLRNFFFSLIGKMHGNWYNSGTYSLFSSVLNFSANIGFRF